MKKVVLFFTFLLLGTSGTFAQSNKYDVNGDGDVNITDVIEFVNYIFGKDIDNVGGDVNVMDVLELVNYILGKDSGGNGSNSPADAIDLGLPSGTKWASCNVGATKPEDCGGLFAWGETEEKEVYNDVTYMYSNGVDKYGDGWYDSYVEFGTFKIWQNLGSDISGTKYDVAHVMWGGNWCMPTMDDFSELLDNSINEWTMLNGAYGLKFTSMINGNSIFLPACPANWFPKGATHYWLSTQSPLISCRAYEIYFDWDSCAYLSDGERRSFGLSVRPIVRN